MITMLIRSEEERLQSRPRDEPPEKEDGDPAESSPRRDLSLRSLVEVDIEFVLYVAEDRGDGNYGKAGDDGGLASGNRSVPFLDPSRRF